LVSKIFKEKALPWWGKVFGGAVSYLVGGPLGSLAGVALGQNVDKDGVEKADDSLFKNDASGVEQGEKSRVQAAFFTATFSVMGHLARSDGTITETEIAMAKKVMDQMKLSKAQKGAAGRLFNEGKRGDFPFYAVLAQFKDECQRRRSLMRFFLEIQLHAALADGALKFQEKKLLIEMANCFEFSKKEFEQITALIYRQHGILLPKAKAKVKAKVKAKTVKSKTQTTTGARSGKAHSGSRIGSLSRKNKDAYDVLGVTENEDPAVIKKAYRRLVSQHHPDKLVAKGLPEEMMKSATEKIQEIKSAYDQIKKAKEF